MKRPWQIKSISETSVQRLSEEAGISPLLARLLALRGIDTRARAHAYVDPAEQEIPHPSEFSEMQCAVARIRRAIERRERILIHGDYDVDGITATCILLETFHELGLPADYFLPDRMESGYGLQEETIRSRAGSYDLLITVDCGTTAVESVRIANDLGLDVIITDHHSAGNERPPALAVLNPVYPNESYPSKNLSGAGVAWKLASALLESYSKSGRADRFLDLVALGMVADVMPLVGENRTLLARALAEFHRLDRPGLLALMDLAKVIPARVGPSEIGFRIAPRLNAAGRMDDPGLALELLLTRDEIRAIELARHLHQLNAQRQSIEAKMLKEACDLIEREGLLNRSSSVLAVVGRDWHRGVLGIVAARLVQMFQRPVFLFTQEENIAIGSARSMDGVDLIPLLDAARPHAVSCGGHAGAAGMKVVPDCLSAFEAALYKAAEDLPATAGPTPLWLDASLPLERIDPAFMDEIQRMEPFGEGNEEPLFFGEGAINGMGARIVGNNHLRLTLRHPRGTLTAIGFGQGDKLETLQGDRVEIAFCCRWNEYQGRRDIDLHFRDIRPSSSAPLSLTRPAPLKTGFEWSRESLGKVYRLLEKSCNEERTLALPNARLLAKLEKIDPPDFDRVLTIFSEIELLAIRDGKIIIHEVKQKRNLTDSPTYRIILETINK